MTRKTKKRRSRKTSFPLLKKVAQGLCNKYCRLRDTGGVGANCISCDRWFSHDELQGGHYRPVGVARIRYDEFNVNAQCSDCNLRLQGNGGPYRTRLVAKVGREEVDRLDAVPTDSYTWTRNDVEYVIEYYTKKLLELGVM